jgi:hypothetical protein
MDPVTEALEDYFNCHHCYTSAALRKHVESNLFNVLTHDTVNKVYTIRTSLGNRQYSPLEVAAQTENHPLTKRLLVELGADLLFSEGAGLHTIRSLLITYANISYRSVISPERVHTVRHDEVVDVLAVGIARISDTDKLRDGLDYTIRRSGLTEGDCIELGQALRPAIQKQMQDIAWSRRRHLVCVYAERLDSAIQ